MSHELRLPTYTTGKTVTANVVSVSSGSISTVSLSESPSGYYSANFPTVNAGIYDAIYFDSGSPIAFDSGFNWNGSGIVTGSTGSATVDLTPIQSQLNTIQAKTNLLGPSVIQVNSPISQTGNITLIQGDDVSLGFTIDNSIILASGTAYLHIASNSDATSYGVSGQVSAQTITISLSSTFTSGLYLGTNAYEYALRLNTFDHRINTLSTGYITVK